MAFDFSTIFSFINFDVFVVAMLFPYKVAPKPLQTRNYIIYELQTPCPNKLQM
jgi:hypothetical protein